MRPMKDPLKEKGRTQGERTVVYEVWCPRYVKFMQEAHERPLPLHVCGTLAEAQERRKIANSECVYHDKHRILRVAMSVRDITP